MSHEIYFDHHATTPLDSRALEAMRPYLETEFGNPSSGSHDWGRRAALAVDEARESVAALLGAEPGEIIFTAGATESNNIAIKGAARAARRAGKGNHLVTTAMEHKAVIESMKALMAEGFSLDVIAPDSNGLIQPQRVRSALRPHTVVVSAAASNGEVGTVQPVAAMGRACREGGVFFHTDATQTVGKLPVDVGAWSCDALSLSAHKFYGPKGVGALYVREGVELEPLFSGGGQERGLRSGTLNVPGIVGLGVVARHCREEMAAETQRLVRLRDNLWARIRERIPGAVLHGSLEHRLPGNLNISFDRVEGEALVLALEGFAASTGSACRSGEKDPSEVLVAMGCEPNLARGAIRFGLGASTTGEQCAALTDALEAAVARLRSLAPVGS